MGVASNNWFDCVLRSIIHMFKTSCWPMLQPPSLGPPSFPLIWWLLIELRSVVSYHRMSWAAFIEIRHVVHITSGFLTRYITHCCVMAFHACVMSFHMALSLYYTTPNLSTVTISYVIKHVSCVSRRSYIVQRGLTYHIVAYHVLL